MADFARASIPSAFSSPYDIRGKIPLLFQVLSVDYDTVLLPEAMYLHVNPSNLSLSYTKSIERFQTRGGWQEQHFGESLTNISASGSTGAFINVDTGLAVARRRDTIAYEKYLHLLDLFHNNGLVYDNFGNVQYRGRVRMMFEGGIYDGAFRNFSVKESSDSTPFAFTFDFTFSVEREIMSIVF